jgi:hypothetical protein
MKTLFISTGLVVAALAGCGNNSGAGGAGGAGAGGMAGSGAGGAPAVMITGDTGSFDNSFLITSCASAGTGFDCPNPPPTATGCPTTPWMPPTGATTEGIGSTYDETFTVTASDPNQIYDVTVHVQGQVEGRTYTGGMRDAVDGSGNPVLPDPNGVANNLLYIGGKPGTTRVDYNVFMLTIAPPDGGQPIADAPTFYAFNSVDVTHEGQHFNYQIDETFTFKVQSGFVVTLTNHDSNCIAIKNCGVGGPYGFSSSALCEAQARTISAVTLPATFMGKALPNGGAQPFQTQFVNFQITSVVAE